MEMWFSEFHTPDVKHSLRVNRHLFSKQSDFQRIDIFETPEFGRVLTLDGNVMLTERDEFIYNEMMTHVPMAVHPHVKNVLIIGGGDGGVAKELLQYKSIDPVRPGGENRPGGNGSHGGGSLPELPARERLPDGRPSGAHLL